MYNRINTLETNQFATIILDNPNKTFCFLTNPDDTYCYFLASVDVFGVQTILANAGKIIGDSAIPCPGAATAFNVTCYDTSMKLAYDREECVRDISRGLRSFKSMYGMMVDTWYLVDIEDIQVPEAV